jgi:hypothetical protein
LCFYLNLAFIYVIGFIVLIFVFWVFVHCFLYRFLLHMYSVCSYFSAALACNWLLSIVRHFNTIIVVTLLTPLAFFFQVSVTVVHSSASFTSLTSCYQGNQRLTLYTHYWQWIMGICVVWRFWGSLGGLVFVLEISFLLVFARAHARTNTRTQSARAGRHLYKQILCPLCRGADCDTIFSEG